MKGPLAVVLVASLLMAQSVPVMSSPGTGRATAGDLKTLRSSMLNLLEERTRTSVKAETKLLHNMRVRLFDIPTQNAHVEALVEDVQLDDLTMPNLMTRIKGMESVTLAMGSELDVAEEIETPLPNELTSERVATIKVTGGVRQTIGGDKVVRFCKTRTNQALQLSAAANLVNFDTGVRSAKLALWTYRPLNFLGLWKLSDLVSNNAFENTDSYKEKVKRWAQDGYTENLQLSGTIGGVEFEYPLLVSEEPAGGYVALGDMVMVEEEDGLKGYQTKAQFAFLVPQPPRGEEESYVAMACYAGLTGYYRCYGATHIRVEAPENDGSFCTFEDENAKETKQAIEAATVKIHAGVSLWSVPNDIEQDPADELGHAGNGILEEYGTKLISTGFSIGASFHFKLNLVLMTEYLKPYRYGLSIIDLASSPFKITDSAKHLRRGETCLVRRVFIEGTSAFKELFKIADGGIGVTRKDHPNQFLLLSRWDDIPSQCGMQRIDPHEDKIKPPSCNIDFPHCRCNDDNRGREEMLQDAMIAQTTWAQYLGNDAVAKYWKYLDRGDARFPIQFFDSAETDGLHDLRSHGKYKSGMIALVKDVLNDYDVNSKLVSNAKEVLGVVVRFPLDDEELTGVATRIFDGFDNLAKGIFVEATKFAMDKVLSARYRRTTVLGPNEGVGVVRGSTAACLLEGLRLQNSDIRGEIEEFRCGEGIGDCKLTLDLKETETSIRGLSGKFKNFITWDRSASEGVMATFGDYMKGGAEMLESQLNIAGRLSRALDLGKIFHTAMTVESADPGSGESLKEKLAELANYVGNHPRFLFDFRLGVSGVKLTAEQRAVLPSLYEMVEKMAVQTTSSANVEATFNPDAILAAETSRDPTSPSAASQAISGTIEAWKGISEQYNNVKEGKFVVFKHMWQSISSGFGKITGGFERMKAAILKKKDKEHPPFVVKFEKESEGAISTIDFWGKAAVHDVSINNLSIQNLKISVGGSQCYEPDMPTHFRGDMEGGLTLEVEEAVASLSLRYKSDIYFRANVVFNTKTVVKFYRATAPDGQVKHNFKVVADDIDFRKTQIVYVGWKYIEEFINKKVNVPAIIVSWVEWYFAGDGLHQNLRVPSGKCDYGYACPSDPLNDLGLDVSTFIAENCKTEHPMSFESSLNFSGFRFGREQRSEAPKLFAWLNTLTNSDQAVLETSSGAAETEERVITEMEAHDRAQTVAGDINRSTALVEQATMGPPEQGWIARVKDTVIAEMESRAAGDRLSSLLNKFGILPEPPATVTEQAVEESSLDGMDPVSALNFLADRTDAQHESGATALIPTGLKPARAVETPSLSRENALDPRMNLLRSNHGTRDMMSYINGLDKKHDALAAGGVAEIGDGMVIDSKVTVNWNIDGGDGSGIDSLGAVAGIKNIDKPSLRHVCCSRPGMMGLRVMSKPRCAYTSFMATDAEGLVEAENACKILSASSSRMFGNSMSTGFQVVFMRMADGMNMGMRSRQCCQEDWKNDISYDEDGEVKSSIWHNCLQNTCDASEAARTSERIRQERGGTRVCCTLHHRARRSSCGVADVPLGHSEREACKDAFPENEKWFPSTETNDGSESIRTAGECCDFAWEPGTVHSCLTRGCGTGRGNGKAGSLLMQMFEKEH